MGLPAQPNQSLIDGLSCLQAVVGRSSPVGGRALARELGLEATRVHRLLKTLEHLGLTAQGPDRKYRAGPGVHGLAAQALFASGLLRRAAPHLEGLGRFGHIVALGVLWGDQVSYLYHALPGMRPAEALGRAGLYPARRSGIGRALLARGDLRRAPAGLRGELRAARERGYAVGLSEPGKRSVGVALPGNEAAAIALAGELDEAEIPALAAALQAAARAIHEAPDPASADGALSTEEPLEPVITTRGVA
jgi:DNA-binding IclR family transcriptional regulator